MDRRKSNSNWDMLQIIKIEVKIYFAVHLRKCSFPPFFLFKGQANKTDTCSQTMID